MKYMPIMSLDLSTTAFVRVVDGKMDLKHISDKVM